MTKAIKALPADITGRRFKTDEGKKFTVVEGDYFSERSISNQHRKYLSHLQTGLLVSVSFYGQPVPLVVVDGGVVRLVSIQQKDDETLQGSSIISKLLGVEETRQPIGLYAD